MSVALSSAAPLISPACCTLPRHLSSPVENKWIHKCVSHGIKQFENACIEIVAFINISIICTETQLHANVCLMREFI